MSCSAGAAARERNVRTIGRPDPKCMFAIKEGRARYSFVFLMILRTKRRPPEPGLQGRHTAAHYELVLDVFFHAEACFLSSRSRV